jgi:hypothetical protein
MSASSGARRDGALFAVRLGVAGERAGPGTRLRARLQRLGLDRRLATGEPAWASPKLRWRAAQLTSPPERRRIADQIDRLIEAAGPPRPRGAAVPLDWTGVLACRELLRELADDLRHAEHVHARGVALIRELLRDGGSPLYAPEVGGLLDRSIRHARAALLLD